MPIQASTFRAAALAACLFSAAACTAATTAPADGTTQTGQQLQKKTNGDPTGDGTICSWGPGGVVVVGSGGGGVVGSGGGSASGGGSGSSTPPSAGSSGGSSPPSGPPGTIPPVPSSPPAVFGVGDTFKSPDGCNDCTCTPQGIACTERTCACGGAPGSVPPSGSGSAGPTPVPPTPPAPPPGIACPDDAKQCPDGSYVGRTGPKCDFAPCGL